jgi:hypothetical protein
VIHHLGNEFNQRTEYIIQNAQSYLRQERLYATSINRRMFSAASVEQGIDFQAFYSNDDLILRRYSPAPSAFNVCTCSVSQNCPDPSWSGGHIFCKNGNNCTKGTIVWSVPGLTTSCNARETILFSDLRCFFDQACFNMLLSMFNVDMPNRLPLPESTLSMTALNSSNLFSFQPDGKLDQAFNKLFVDKWELLPDFIGYYRICAPLACTYTIDRKLDIIYIVTTIIGLLGGVTIVLRLLIPVIVRFAHSIVSRWKRSGSNINNQVSENHPGKKYKRLFMDTNSNSEVSITSLKRIR